MNRKLKHWLRLLGGRHKPLMGLYREFNLIVIRQSDHEILVGIEDQSTLKYIQRKIEVGNAIMNTRLQNDLYEMIQAALIERFPVPKLKDASLGE